MGQVLFVLYTHIVLGGRTKKVGYVTWVGVRSSDGVSIFDPQYCDVMTKTRFVPKFGHKDKLLSSE